MRLVLKVLAALALAAFVYDYVHVRADAICAHNNVVRLTNHSEGGR